VLALVSLLRVFTQLPVLQCTSFSMCAQAAGMFTVSSKRVQYQQLLPLQVPRVLRQRHKINSEMIREHLEYPSQARRTFLDRSRAGPPRTLNCHWYSVIGFKNKQNKLHGLSPRANYTDRATAACRRSDFQLLRIEGATWSA
jgi:hypothetical protein